MISKRMINGYPLTWEQNSIVDAVRRAISLKILAFAGTGKTSTLRAIAEYSGASRIIYIAFNSEIAREAKASFPGHVRCMTAHGLAYRNVLTSSLWMQKFHSAYNGTRIPAKDIYEICKLPNYHRDTKSTKFQLSVFVTVTLNCFMQSAESKILYSHVPPEVYAAFGDPESDRIRAFIKKIRDFTRLLWSAVSDEHNVCPMTHDAYLKIYQLSKPTINANLIMIDEAQDLNPVLLDILSHQTMQKVFVGDNHQQIYAWRGAVNSLSGLDYETFHLTHSFRFGPAIADLANVCLFAKNEPVRIVGAGKGAGRFNPNNPYAFLARSNSVIFAELTKAINQGKKVHVVGDMTNILRLFEGAYWLWMDDSYECKAPELKPFKTWEQFCEYVKQTNDREFQRVQNFIEKHKGNTLNMCQKVRQYKMSSEPEADLILSTVHKSKGREWAQVLLAKDIEMPDRESSDFEAEMNIIYVAITRAINALHFSKPMAEQLASYLKIMKIHDKSKVVQSKG